MLMKLKFVSLAQSFPLSLRPIYPVIYSTPLWTQQTQNDLTWFSKWPNLSFLAWWTHFFFDMTNIVKFKKAGMPAFENLRQMNHNRFLLGVILL